MLGMQLLREGPAKRSWPALLHNRITLTFAPSSWEVMKSEKFLPIPTSAVTALIKH